MHKEKAAGHGNVQAARECMTDSAHNNPSPNPPQEHLNTAARLIVASVWLRHTLTIGDQSKARDAYRRARDQVHAMAPYLDGGEA